MDKYDWMALKGIIIIAVVVIAMLFGISYWIVGLKVGQRYKTNGHVRFYEQSSWIEPHTTVILDSFGGTEIKIILIGYHEFEIGNAYRIKTVCRRSGFLGLGNWYEVLEKTEIS